MKVFLRLLNMTIGLILGGMVGIGTIISAIAIGFCIQITFGLFKFDVMAVKHEDLGDTFNGWLVKSRKD